MTKTMTHSNYNGVEDKRIREFWVKAKHVKCPLCEHNDPVLTLAHIMKNHGKTLEEAKVLRDNAEIIQPFRERGMLLYAQNKRHDTDRFKE